MKYCCRDTIVFCSKKITDRIRANEEIRGVYFQPAFHRWDQNATSKSNMFDDCIFLSLRFPQKLWRIVNECKSGAIRWSLSGNTILLDYKKFQKQYLDAGNSIFKTKNITSFIRQLNLYGFRKVTSHNRDPICNSHNPDVHEFLHENFRTGRPDLLSRVYRKTVGKLKHCQRINLKTITEPDLFSKDNDHVSRLHMCRLALTKALEQITRDYQRTHNHATRDQNSLSNTANSHGKVLGLDLYAARNHEINVEWITKNAVPICSKKDNSNGYATYPWDVRKMSESHGKYL